MVAPAIRPSFLLASAAAVGLGACAASAPIEDLIGQDAGCAAEVVDLHRFFEEWFTGCLADTDASFDRFAARLEADFVIVGPAGVPMAREELLVTLRGMHGRRSSAFRIWIENLAARPVGRDLWLVTYEEWQREGPSAVGRGRLSSALLRYRAADAGGGAAAATDLRPAWRWLHVHETWLPAP